VVNEWPYILKAIYRTALAVWAGAHFSESGQEEAIVFDLPKSPQAVMRL
jgi:hypothetical protein